MGEISGLTSARCHQGEADQRIVDREAAMGKKKGKKGNPGQGRGGGPGTLVRTA
jgi:hypothetical protein